MNEDLLDNEILRVFAENSSTKQFDETMNDDEDHGITFRPLKKSRNIQPSSLSNQSTTFRLDFILFHFYQLYHNSLPGKFLIMIRHGSFQVQVLTDITKQSRVPHLTMIAGRSTSKKAEKFIKNRLFGKEIPRVASHLSISQRKSGAALCFRRTIPNSYPSIESRKTKRKRHDHVR
jgi:hypothetical protein